MANLKRRRKSRSYKRIIIMASVLICVVVGIVLITTLGQGKSKESLLQDGKYVDGVTVEEVNVSGKSYSQAKELVEAVAATKIKEYKLELKVKDKKAQLTTDQLAIESNLEDVLLQALKYGNEGSEAHQQKSEAQSKGKSFALEYACTSDLDAVVDQMAEELDELPTKAKIVVEKGASESSLSTTASLKYEDDKDGYKIDQKKLVEQIKTDVKSLAGAQVTLEYQTVKSNRKAEELKQNTDVIGQFSTSFSGSPLNKANRVYNIWKMSDAINGVSIQPGETWSMNDEAGDRTESRGWKLAAGLENGATSDQAGGGICQVSSTLYNAALKAELEIEERKRHSVPSKYVPIGLDATISSGGPDLKIKNNTDYPIYIVCICDKSQGTVTVKIYGQTKNRDYRLKFTNEIVESVEPDEPETKVVKEMEPGTKNILRKATTGKRVKVYKEKYDLQTGELLDKTLLYEDYYRPFHAIIEQGPEKEKPKPTEKPEPTETPSESKSPTTSKPTDSSSPSSSKPTNSAKPTDAEGEDE